MKHKIIKKKYENITIGYEVIVEGSVVYTIFKNDSNRTWNIFEGGNVLTGHLDTFDTFRECKEAIKEWLQED